MSLAKYEDCPSSRQIVWKGWAAARYNHFAEALSPSHRFKRAVPESTCGFGYEVIPCPEPRSPMARDPIEPPPLPDMVGSSPAMSEVYRLTRLAAPTNANVLLIGETGTGKEVIARPSTSSAAGPTVRSSASTAARCTRTCWKANCSAHVKGAFTGAVENKTGRFEAAHGGTIFLDEINEHLAQPAGEATARAAGT
jgi:transcriptional regulator with AAA-type ATPase domain